MVKSRIFNFTMDFKISIIQKFYLNLLRIFFGGVLFHKKRLVSGIQMKPNELALVINSLKKFTHPNFLVFGFGNDTKFWMNQNKLGRTVFIEDNKEWFNKTKAKINEVEAYLVKYPNNVTMWKDLINKPEKLLFELPETITSTKWDVILVDAPAGYKASHEVQLSMPGRMSSIYIASKLVAEGGYVLVHDCNREVEAAYTDAYLGDNQLVDIALGRSELRRYQKNID